MLAMCESSMHEHPHRQVDGYVYPLAASYGDQYRQNVAWSMIEMNLCNLRSEIISHKNLQQSGK